jgi:hypothetical protein
MCKRALGQAVSALLLLPTLAACGNIAGASTPATPPPLPPAPPLSREAAAALAEPAPTVPPAPELPITASAALLSERFDDSLTGWSVVDFSEAPAGPASWEVAEGAAVQAGDALGLPDPGGTYLLAGEATWQHYRVRADLFAERPTQLGLVARRSSEGYYQARLVADEGRSQIVLEAIDAEGQTRELDRSDAPAVVGRWLRLELRVQGSSIRATLDGATVVQADDQDFKQGQVGLYAEASGAARFDNVVVEP